MKFKISYIKNTTPKNKITEEIVTCHNLKEAVETAKRNMGDNNLACLYYGKDFKNLRIVHPFKYILGFLCHDGCFSVIYKNGKQYEFTTYQEAEEEIKKLQPKYKHRLESFRL